MGGNTEQSVLRLVVTLVTGSALTALLFASVLVLLVSRQSSNWEHMTLDPSPRERATILVLCRNSDLDSMLRTMREFEGRFNGRFRYPYVFLNDQPWTWNFRQTIRSSTLSSVRFGVIDPSDWAIPPHIDRHRMQEAMSKSEYVYGKSQSYRQMCRWYSGKFYDHPLLSDYDFYWRVEPGVRFTCDIRFDPFREMAARNKTYAFTIALKEIVETVPTLWSHLKQLPTHSQHSLEAFLTPSNDYNMCHFWSNFEIARLDFFRSRQYRELFAQLDAAGGFFYERWGDAPVHSLAVGKLLSREDVLWLGDRIGYEHYPHSVCPRDFRTHTELRCECHAGALGCIHPGSECMLPWTSPR